MEAIGRVAGGIAHDFNNILMAVGGSVELAADRMRTDAAAKEEFALAREGLEMGRRLARQLLDVARAEETKAEYIDINDFLARSTKLLSSMVSLGTALEVTAEPAIGGVMIAPGQLTQVLMNLVINARDAMPNRGTIKVHATTLSALSAHRADPLSGPNIMISVIDQGSGIPSEELEHVFEPFFTTKAEQGGSVSGSRRSIRSFVRQVVTSRSPPRWGVALASTWCCRASKVDAVDAVARRCVGDDVGAKLTPRAGAAHCIPNLQ